MTAENGNWKDGLEMRAQKFSRDMEDLFRNAMKDADGLLPKQPSSTRAHEEHQFEQINLFFDYLLGTTVCIAARYINMDKEFEMIFLTNARDKFEKVRQLHKEGKL